jgi:hypothetical protein
MEIDQLRQEYLAGETSVNEAASLIREVLEWLARPMTHQPEAG